MRKRILKKAPIKRPPVQPEVGKFYSLQYLFAQVFSDGKKRRRKVELDPQIARVVSINKSELPHSVECVLLDPETGEMSHYGNLSVRLLYAELPRKEVNKIIRESIKNFSLRLKIFANF